MVKWGGFVVVPSSEAPPVDPAHDVEQVRRLGMLAFQRGVPLVDEPRRQGAVKAVVFDGEP